MRKALLAAAGVAMALGAQAPAGAAVVLTGNVTADNYFFAYLSDSPGSQGSLIGQGSNWQQTYSVASGDLSPGVYYLNIVAQNWTGEAGLVGAFDIGGLSLDTSARWSTAYVSGAWSLGDPLGAPGQP